MRKLLSISIIATALLIISVSLVLVISGTSHSEKDKAIAKLLSHSVIKDIPSVKYGEPIDPESILISIDKDGVIYRMGKETTLAEIPELKWDKKEANLTPIMLEVHNSLSISSTINVLEKLERAFIVNISFLVTTPDGRKCLPLPITCEHGCNMLWFYNGRNEYKVKDSHLWIDAKLKDSKSINVDYIGIGEYQHRRGGRICEAIEDISEENGKIDNKTQTQEDIWVGEHPPLGVWDIKTLDDFIIRPGVAKLEPFIILEAWGRNSVPNLLSCLSSLRQIFDWKIVTEIHMSESPK
ncbi:MAG: hypothetical protein V1701_12365 [Planctomycetota bacterium]